MALGSWASSNKYGTLLICWAMITSAHERTRPWLKYEELSYHASAEFVTPENSNAMMECHRSLTKSFVWLSWNGKYSRAVHWEWVTALDEHCSMLQLEKPNLTWSCYRFYEQSLNQHAAYLQEVQWFRELNQFTRGTSCSILSITPSLSSNKASMSIISMVSGYFIEADSKLILHGRDDQNLSVQWCQGFKVWTPESCVFAMKYCLHRVSVAWALFFRRVW